MDGVEGKVALVIGDGGGVGKALAKGLVEGRSEVVMIDDDLTRLAEIRKGFADMDFGPETVAADIFRAEEVEATVNRVVRNYGRVDLLINNVDHESVGSIEDSPVLDIEALFKRNFLPVHLFARQVIPAMKKQGFGRIVNISGIDCLGAPEKSGYAAVKSALLGFTRSLAREVVREGITVNCLVKGDIRPPEEELPEEKRALLEKSIPVRRLGSPDDIAYAVGFLSAEHSSYITGQVLFVCGGKSVHFSMSV